MAVQTQLRLIPIAASAEAIRDMTLRRVVIIDLDGSAERYEGAAGCGRRCSIRSLQRVENCVLGAPTDLSKLPD